MHSTLTTRWVLLSGMLSLAGSVTAFIENKGVFNPQEFSEKLRGPARAQAHNAMVTPAPKLAERDAETSQIAVLLIGTRTYSIGEANGNILFGSNTISPGAPAQTIDGDTVSFGPQGLVVDGESTFPVNVQNTMAAAAGLQGAVVTLGNISVTYTAGGNLDLGGVTLTPGGPAAAAGGTTVWIDASGLVVNGAPIPLTPLGSAAPTAITTAPFPTLANSAIAGFNTSLPDTSNSGGSAAESSGDTGFVQNSGSLTTNDAQSTKISSGISTAQAESDGSKIASGARELCQGLLAWVVMFLWV